MIHTARRLSHARSNLFSTSLYVYPYTGSIVEHLHIYYVHCFNLFSTLFCALVFYLDTLRTGAMSLINKDTHVESSGYVSRMRPWICGIGDPGTGKSHAADPHSEIIEEVTKLFFFLHVASAFGEFEIEKLCPSRLFIFLVYRFASYLQFFLVQSSLHLHLLG